MALIQVARLARKLQRSLRLTTLPDSILAPETVAVIIVEDLSPPLEDEERGCMGDIIMSAVALEKPLIVLVRVGAPARYDLVVTRIWFSSLVDQLMIVRIPTAGVTGLTPTDHTSFVNLEVPGRPSSQLGEDTQTGIPVGRNLFTVEVLARTTYMVDVNIRIGTIGQPGDLTSLMIAGNSVNTAIRGGFAWTESAPQG